MPKLKSLFLFFFSGLILTFIIYFPTVFIYVILWILYFNFSSSDEEEEKSSKKVDDTPEYYDILVLLNDQPNSKHSIDLISRLEKLSTHDKSDKSASNSSKSSFHESKEILYSLIKKMIDSKKENKFFSLDEWLKSDIVGILPSETNEDFEYFVSNNRDKIASLNKSDEEWMNNFRLILSSKPRPDIISFGKDGYEYPEYFKKKEIIFNKYIDDPGRKGKQVSIISGEKLWALINGNADFFISYDYSSWFPKNTKMPYWLIPFSLYRWWTPENYQENEKNDSWTMESFMTKLLLFGTLNLAKTTKENMFNDILYLFLSAYIKQTIQDKNQNNFSRISPILEIARISAMINNKFEAYCLIGLLEAENIVKANPIVYDEIVTQCINFLIQQSKESWILSAFILTKEIKNKNDNEIYKTQLRQLLEQNSTETDILNKEEESLAEPSNDKLNRFKIEESLIYEVKGEKIIFRAVREYNKEELTLSFRNGINCLLKGKKYTRAFQLLVDYYLKWICETGNDISDLDQVYIQIKDYIEQDETADKAEINENDDNFILDIVTKCYKKNPITNNDLDKIFKVLRKENKTYNLRRFVFSLLVNQDIWCDYLTNNFNDELFEEIDAVPKDEIFYYKYINDLNNIDQ